MELTFEQKLSIVSERVSASSDYGNYSEMMIKRFLRGQKLNVDNAVKCLVATGEFRKETRADVLTVKDCEGYYNRRVTFPFGYDNMGQPLIYCITGRHDRLDRDINEVKNFIIFIIDQTLKLAKPDEEKLTIVFDLSTFSMNCMDFEATKLFISVLQTHYPEILGRALIINAPYIFRACWQVIRPWLDPVTASKVEFIRSNQLNTYISPENICEDFRILYKMPAYEAPSVVSEELPDKPFTNEDAHEVEERLHLDEAP